MLKSAKNRSSSNSIAISEAKKNTALFLLPGYSKVEFEDASKAQEQRGELQFYYSSGHFSSIFSPVKWEFAGYINRGKACEVRGKVIEDACEVVGSCGGSWPFWLSSQYPHKNHEMSSDIIQSMERDEKQQVTARTYKSNPG